jgi:hypothetical protein
VRSQPAKPETKPAPEVPKPPAPQGKEVPQ